MSDDRAASLERLLLHVAEVGEATPSLGALYALESDVEYLDFWHPASTVLRHHCNAQRARDAWLAEFRKPPPDFALWLPFHRRSNVKAEQLRDAVQRWCSREPEKIFEPHHYISGELEGIAAIHITMFLELDPVGAVEYVAALPSEILIWPAVARMRLGERSTLIDRVLVESRSRDAILLSLASSLEQQCLDIKMLINRQHWTQRSDCAEEMPSSGFSDAWALIRNRYQQLAAQVAQRDDAGALFGPWMRHLVRYVDQAGRDDLRSQIAMVALEAILVAYQAIPTIELEPMGRRDAACLVARTLTHTRTGLANSDWQEWGELLVAADESLRSRGDVAWQAAAEALLGTIDPHKAWLGVARALQPQLRRRERLHSSQVDSTVHLAMAGMHASAILGRGGAELWSSVYEFARRRFLVDRPLSSELRYWLSSDVFVAVPRIFDNTKDVEGLLAMLPTPEHLVRARQLLIANPLPSSIA